MGSVVLWPKIESLQLLNRTSNKEWKMGKEILKPAATCFINTELEINICGSLHTLERTPSSLCHREGPKFGEYGRDLSPVLNSSFSQFTVISAIFLK